MGALTFGQKAPVAPEHPLHQGAGRAVAMRLRNGTQQLGLFPWGCVHQDVSLCKGEGHAELRIQVHSRLALVAAAYPDSAPRGMPSWMGLVATGASLRREVRRVRTHMASRHVASDVRVLRWRCRASQADAWRSSPTSASRSLGETGLRPSRQEMTYLP